MSDPWDQKLKALVYEAYDLKGSPYILDACYAIVDAHERRPLDDYMADLDKETLTPERLAHIEEIRELLSVRPPRYTSVTRSEGDEMSDWQDEPTQTTVPVEPQNLEITGTLVGIEPRQGGWVSFLIKRDGQEYPVRIDTKREEIIARAQPLAGKRVDARYSQKPGRNINPHTGNPYDDRLLIAIRASQSAAPQQDGLTSYQQHTTPASYTAPQQQESDNQRSLRIMRQAAMKSPILAHLISQLADEEQTFMAVVAICEDMMEYFVNGPEAWLGALEQAALDGDQPSPDDDIPFS